MRAPFAMSTSRQSVFSWIVSQEARLHRYFQLMSARWALGRAHARFAAAYPRMAQSYLDARFVMRHVAPMLVSANETGAPLQPEAIAAAWVEAQRGPAADAGCYDLTAITVAARELLACLGVEAAEEPDATTGAALFAEALRAGSNLAMDWLWLASQVRDEEQRRYCYQQALWIDPGCEQARRALSALRFSARELALAQA